MNYIKVAIKITPYNKNHLDILIALMSQHDFEGFIELQNGLEAFIPENLYSESLIKQIIKPLHDIRVSYTSEIIQPKNWNKEWEKNYFRPIVISNKCVVRSPFHNEYPELPIQIIIEPKMSFGTGHHETTSLMMQFIIENDFKGKRVLDMGCGSGILGILASIEGAAFITAIDIDENCIKNSEENFKINNIKNVEIIKGDASALQNMEDFDIILANISRNVLIDDMAVFAKKLKQNKSLLIVSGIYTHDMQDINEVAEKNQLRVHSSKENNNWMAIAYEPKNP